MYSKYKILQDKQIIIEFHSGVMTLEELELFTSNQIKDPFYNPDYNMLIDIRDVEVELNAEEVDKYVKYVLTHDNIHGKRKDAILTNTSIQVALASLYAGMQHLLKTQIEVFSTIESALRWIATSPISEREVSSIIEELKD